MFKKLCYALKNRKGFTLVELMVVVVIIGILAGIAVPVYSNIQDRAKQGAGEANAKILNRGIEQWEMIKNNGESFDQSTDEDSLLEFLGFDSLPEYVEWEGKDADGGDVTGAYGIDSSLFD